MKISTLLAIAPLCAGIAQGLELDVKDKDSIKQAAKTAAKNLIALYPQNQTEFIPGIFGDVSGGVSEEYPWFIGGQAFSSLIDYSTFTGDSTYNGLVVEGLMHQVGDDLDYQPANQTLSLGNDDQAFWGLAALNAAERSFVFPTPSKARDSMGPRGWLDLATAVFGRQVTRWDEGSCSGGLRWQVFSSNKGYDYKNSASNGLFFLLSARLARFTGNATYAEWAQKSWDWSKATGLISKDYEVFDGVHTSRCGDLVKLQWTANSGAYTLGAAALYDYYASADKGKQGGWKSAVNGLLDRADKVFFIAEEGGESQGGGGGGGGGGGNILAETACEDWETPAKVRCNVDQRALRASYVQFLSQTVQLAPFAKDRILTRLEASAKGAAKVCDDVCSMRWWDKGYDADISPYGVGKGGVVEQLAAMEVFQSLLVVDAKAPGKDKSQGRDIDASNPGSANGTASGVRGGSSGGDSGDGEDSDSDESSGAIRVGPAISTAAIMGAISWMLV